MNLKHEYFISKIKLCGPYKKVYFVQQKVSGSEWSPISYLYSPLFSIFILYADIDGQTHSKSIKQLKQLGTS